MDPIAVDIRLIRAVLGAELRVAPGRALMARVVNVNPMGRGTLSIAGMPVDAKLPPGVQAGQDLRLVVRHVSPEQVVLSLSGEAGAAAAQPQAAAELPGGGRVRVTERDADSETDRATAPGTGRQVLALAYDAPALGTVDLRFELDPQSLRVNATLAAGAPAASATDAAGELRDALSEALGGRPVTVEITPRREPLDVYA
ncbi:MAG TPA: hypothetical protein VLC49_02745 [Solirubrobacteraceae bacterium]|nr:hypothetical protein [Solirubrobacteraceae bacterium]